MARIVRFHVWLFAFGTEKPGDTGCLFGVLFLVALFAGITVAFFESFLYGLLVFFVLLYGIVGVVDAIIGVLKFFSWLAEHYSN